MDPNYKPPSSLDLAKLPPRKPSPRGSMDTNVPTTSGKSPCTQQCKNYVYINFILVYFNVFVIPEETIRLNYSSLTKQ